MKLIYPPLCVCVSVCVCVCVCVWQVITYLNDEINKWQMGLTGTTGTTAAPSYRKYGNKYDVNYENSDEQKYGKNGDYEYDKYDGKYGNQLPYKAESTATFPDTPIFKDSSTLIQVPNNSDYSSQKHFSVPNRMMDVNVISYSPDTIRNKMTYNTTQKNNEDIISNDFISVGVEKKKNQNDIDNNNYDNSDYEKNRIQIDNKNKIFNQNAEIVNESGRDILLRGIQNLGLGSSFGSLEGLGLDLSLGKEMNENFISVFKDTVKGRIIPETPIRNIDNNNIDSRGRPRAQLKNHQSNLDYNRDGNGSGVSVRSRNGDGGGGGDKRGLRDQKGYQGMGSGTGTGARSKGVGVDLESLAYYATGNGNNRIQSQ